MTRGKHSSAKAGSLAAELAAAKDRVRTAEIEARALRSQLEDARQGEQRLRARLIERRSAEVERGTYTHKEVDALLADLRRDFHDRILEAHRYLHDSGAIDSLQAGELLALSSLLDIKPGELMTGVRRAARRFSERDVHVALSGYARRNLGKG